MPAPMSEQIPGTGNATPAYPGSGYDPLNPTPYKPPTEATTLPTITAPPPKISEEGMQPPKTPGPMGKGTTGKIGGAAFLADSILRGVMRGRQAAQQSQAAKTDKLAKGLQFAYQNAANHYVDLVKGGADPKSKEVVEAGMAADAAWQAMMGMYGNYILGDGKKDKKSGKSSKGKSGGGGPAGGDQPENPASLLLSQDPQDKIKGWFMISQKSGPPYKYQAQQYMTPEYQQDRQTYRQSQQDEARLAELQHKERTGTLTDPEKTELATFNKQRFQAQGKMEKKVDSKTTPDNHHWSQWQMPDGTLEWRDEGEARGFAAETKPVRAWQKDSKGKLFSVLLDPKTNQPQPGSENYDIAPPANLQDTIRTGEFSWVDNDGMLHRSATTTTTTHAPHGGSGGSGGSGGGAPATPAAGTAAAGQQPTAPAVHAAPAADQRPRGDRVIGDTGKGQGAKSIRKQAEKVQPLANLLAVQTQYMDDIKKDATKANPRSDLALVIAAVRSMNPGSIRLPNKELELEVKAGSFGQRFSRWFNNTLTGTLPNDQREQLFKIIHDETTMTGENVVKDWHAKIPGEPLPSFLQQFDKSGGGGSGSSSGGKTASRQHLKDYAAAKNITEQQAEQEFKDAGYTIQ